MPHRSLLPSPRSWNSYLLASALILSAIPLYSCTVEPAPSADDEGEESPDEVTEDAGRRDGGPSRDAAIDSGASRDAGPGGGKTADSGARAPDAGKPVADPGSNGDGSVDRDDGGRPPPKEQGAPTQKSTENLFVSVLGKSAAEVDAKVTEAVGRFFGAGTKDPVKPSLADGVYRLYYELPQDDSAAFIWAADSMDVRSEGMSYGMMIAVQMGMREQFDKLWNFSKKYMQYPADSDAIGWRHYFRWKGTVDFSGASDWKVNFAANESPAPDGEEYFAAALYLAAARWGSEGELKYKEEADKIAKAMLHNQAEMGRFPIIHQTANMVVFVPFFSSNEHSDPSYHLPAFYELFAEVGPAEDASRWLEIAKVSRDYFVKSAHPETGLHPDYATFDGKPEPGYNPADLHDQFRFDAWRMVMNMALDHAWSKQPDPRLKTQIEKYHAFFEDHLGPDNVTASLFKVDGSSPGGGGSTALTASLAAGSLASEHALRKRYVETLWAVPQQAGRYRYYQECVYLLGMLKVAGRYQTAW